MRRCEPTTGVREMREKVKQATLSPVCVVASINLAFATMVAEPLPWCDNNHPFPLEGNFSYITGATIQPSYHSFRPRPNPFLLAVIPIPISYSVKAS